jgi:hypothetical protein
MLLFQLCEMRVNRHPNPPFLIAATVIFGPNEPPGSSLPRWATVKGVPNYRKAGIRGFMRSVAFSTHAKPNVYVRPGYSRRGGREPSRGSVLIDGEVVCCDEKGGAAFQLLRHRRNEPRAFLYVFDLLELNGTGLRREPIEVRKATAGEHPCARAGVFATTIRPPARATRPRPHARSRCTETAGSLGVCGRARAVA